MSRHDVLSAKGDAAIVMRSQVLVMQKNALSRGKQAPSLSSHRILSYHDTGGHGFCGKGPGHLHDCFLFILFFFRRSRSSPCLPSSGQAFFASRPEPGKKQILNRHQVSAVQGWERVGRGCCSLKSQDGARDRQDQMPTERDSPARPQAPLGLMRLALPPGGSSAGTPIGPQRIATTARFG